MKPDKIAWNVVSGGPSRRYIEKSDLIEGGAVVTVNRAIDIVDRGITVDFAAFADPPTGCWNQENLERFLKPHTQIWVPMTVATPTNIRDVQATWEPVLPAWCGIRQMPTGYIQGVTGKNHHIFTLACAIERVFMFRPKQLRILCADMMGPWAKGKSEEECEEMQSENQTLKDMITAITKELDDPPQGMNADQFRMMEHRRLDLQLRLHHLERMPPVPFKRWQHEKQALEKMVERAKSAFGLEVEFKTPSKALVAV